MIQIIELNQEQLTQITSYNFKDVYAVPLHVIAKMMSIAMPIKNRNIAIKNILEFLKYADQMMDMSGDSLLTLNSNTLNEYFSMKKRTAYLDILKDLKVMSAVPRDNGKFYEIRKCSTRYRFHNEYVFGELAIVLIDTDKEKSLTSDIKIDKRFKQAIKLTEIDIQKAIPAEIDNCKDNNKLRIRLNNLFDTKRDRYIKKGNNVDRIYHTLTKISRVSRKFQSIENMKYFNIDIVNCQPMLLCYYLKKQGLKIDDNYLQDCENGCVYERFLGITGSFTVKRNGFWNAEEITLDRNEVKKQLYRSIYFNFDTRNLANKEFAKLYPTTYESLKNVSSDSTIASVLQNIEAEIFNSLSPKDSKYFYTLFDAIYFTSESDKNKLVSDIQLKFAIYDLKPSIKVSDI